ncbi:unnamed protein product [Parascedosporium putredinis]|uniref:Endo-chitosanase n=1 Tax=Parascedosporium putredinis TaxID=1442378 RepID=A0A9P1GZL9_9PEZI|nr:unnamed protein product [Parascedosporium putredinis]CAI7991916.1 unnamed protein product [Parascedosporium putredinis]
MPTVLDSSTLRRGPNTASYCGDYLDDYKIVYIQGTDGALSNMDVDCDGAQGGSADDGRCDSSTDTQSISSFQSTIASYKAGIRDLDANIHPYIVFGNEGTKRKWKTFDPQEVGIKPLSVMAVVCGGKLVYGASISVATACFGTRMSGNSGYDEDDVLYIAFVGDDAVPGAKGANWSAANYEAFSASIQDLGDRLVERIGVGNASDKEDAGTTTKMTLLAGAYPVLPVLASLMALLILI